MESATVPVVPVLTDGVSVLSWVRAHGLGEFAELVGRWVWVQFPAKPDDAVRDLLKGAGFQWSAKRGRWYHTCDDSAGRRRGRRPGRRDPRDIWGRASVAELGDEGAAS